METNEVNSFFGTGSRRMEPLLFCLHLATCLLRSESVSLPHWIWHLTRTFILERMTVESCQCWEMFGIMFVSWELMKFTCCSAWAAVWNHFPLFEFCDVFIEIRKCVTATANPAFDPNSYFWTNDSRIMSMLEMFGKVFVLRRLTNFVGFRRGQPFATTSLVLHVVTRLLRSGKVLLLHWIWHLTRTAILARMAIEYNWRWGMFGKMFVL